MQLINTFRFIISKAFKFSQELFTKKSLKKFINLMNNPDHSDGLKALSAAVGIFVGIIPVWGLQTLAAVFIAMTFRLNKALVLLFSQVSLPPLVPLVVVLSYRSGRIWMPGSPTALVRDTSKQGINHHFLQYLYGSVTLALFLAVICGFAAYATFKLLKVARKYRPAAL